MQMPLVFTMDVLEFLEWKDPFFNHLHNKYLMVSCMPGTALNIDDPVVRKMKIKTKPKQNLCLEVGDGDRNPWNM